MPASSWTLRSGTPGDAAEIHTLVCELADFEGLSHQVVSSAGDLEDALGGDPPRLEALVAEGEPAPGIGDGPPRLVGMALFYPTFSTFTGKPGLWLEDVYVRPAFRRQGLGRAFLERFLDLARQRGCARAEWSVLDWNGDAIRLYEGLGATVMPDWRIARVEC